MELTGRIIAVMEPRSGFLASIPSVVFLTSLVKTVLSSLISRMVKTLPYSSISTHVSIKVVGLMISAPTMSYAVRYPQWLILLHRHSRRHKASPMLLHHRSHRHRSLLQKEGAPTICHSDQQPLLLITLRAPRHQLQRGSFLIV